MPKVSLVTTIFNREACLPQAIESVLTQSFTDFELILWDDGSTDRSLNIAHHYAAQDARIKVIGASHQGRGSAIAQACAQAQGEYIGIVDSDDLLAPNALAITVPHLDQQPHLGLVYTDYTIIDEANQIKSPGQHQTPYDHDRLLVEFMIFHFRIFRHSIYQTVGGFDPEFDCSQDYDLCLKISEVADIQKINQPLYYYRHHRQSICGQRMLEQIQYSQRAIENALQRRGMANDYELELQIFAHCHLIKK
ncbi:MAG: glycosyltransferase [Alkalinema sp. RL_2_19]|nr:glycosyltransferase [Alkalinema sp. RL_2_19]